MKGRAAQILTKAQLLVLASCVLLASVSSSETRRPCPATAALSTFDYVVLASIADSPNPLAMSAYDRMKVDGAPLKGALDDGDNTRSLQCRL
jgi:hypothetical protein